jgi:hypothetical protein
MGPGMVMGDDFDLDIKVVQADGPQPVRAADTERCTARYGGYTCNACSTVGCLTVVFCGVSNYTCCYWSQRR